MEILFISPYPLGVAASQRFRFEQYFSQLAEKKISYTLAPFLTEKAWTILYKEGYWEVKFMAILAGFFKRYALLFKLRKYDFVFIHREAVPLGPPLWEFIVAKILRKKIIYDFDDAIWLPNASETNRFFSIFKWYSNVRYLCRIAYRVSCGNDYLCEFAKKYNSSVVYNPTTIDTERYHSEIKKEFNTRPVIGWTGSHSTLKYLDELVPVLQKLEKEHRFSFLVISDTKPEIALSSFEFRTWTKEKEISDLLEIDIGVMPLEDDKWAKGKCGFKALQYMSLGIPALVSAVGVNTRIVDHGINGFVCHTPQEWEKYINELLSEHDKVRNLAVNTRKKVVDQYSVLSNSSNFIHLFT
jgi:glycosyltransferase involved in cell wall biosynthesis